jgi:NTP pyrophosphatase (non-canonical NTP hydrolase)
MLPDNVRITMMPNERTISSLQESIHEWARSKGWWDEEKQKSFIEALMLVATELGEAVEEYRNGKAYNLTYYEEDENGGVKPEGIPSELADVFIRLVDTCAFFGIDLEQAVIEKMLYNAQRPYRHGDKKA